jgi:hypothetical protein
LVKRVEVDEREVRIVYRVSSPPIEDRPQQGLLQHCWGRRPVFGTPGRPQPGPTPAWFLAPRDELGGRLRGDPKRPVIWARAQCHPSQEVAVDRGEPREGIARHLRPKSSPAWHPLERMWWPLHEEITRTPRGQTREELWDLRFAWLRSRNPLKIEGSVSKVQAAA